MYKRLFDFRGEMSIKRAGKIPKLAQFQNGKMLHHDFFGYLPT
jgi:hypothetical protein